MRRYTATKSNVYASTSTNLLSQNIIHNHMVSHYRRTYFARSKVDTSPPWKYKTRDLVSPDRLRKKANKLLSIHSKVTESYRAELELQNKTVAGGCNYDSKQSPTSYKSECTVRRHVISEPKRKESWHVEKSKNEAQNDPFECNNVGSNSSLNMALKKQRQVPQFRKANWQAWNKKGVCSSKRNLVYGKNKAITQDRLKECIPRSLGKSRLYQSSQSNHRDFKDNRGCVSSGSEGNAGDDEDGTPTSCDDSNPSPRDALEKQISTHKAATAKSDTSHRCILEEEKQDLCLCLAPVKEAKIIGSRASSRDSAYEGGECMSSAENPRNSPYERESKWFHRCIDADYERKSIHASEEASQFCGKSELYMKFLQDVTDDILVQAVFSNEALERIFQDHIDCNVYDLDVAHMKLMIDKLKDDLGIPDQNYNSKQTYTVEIEQDLKNSQEIISKTRSNWSGKTREVGLSEMVGTHFALNPRNIIGRDDIGCSWTKNHAQDEKTNCGSSIKIDQNISMSRKEIIDYLSDVGFDHSLSEEIYQLLAGNHSNLPEIAIQGAM